jgi:hypothetical protein
LIELLADVLHRRSKDGHYSEVSFGLKPVLLAIRCLLTHRENQMLFASSHVESHRFVAPF